jgi:hypothetical protein
VGLSEPVRQGRLRSIARVLRHPPVWLLWAAAAGVGFLWSMAVLGMSMELAKASPPGWVVVPFGITPLVVLLLLELDAEPNAMGFYERMGAVRVGVTASTLVPGRELPRMRVPLDEQRGRRRMPR